MNRLAIVAATLLLVGGCGREGKGPGQVPAERAALPSDIAQARVAVVHGTGNDKVRMYAVGNDLQPGVYVSRSGDECGSFAATTASFDLGGDDDGFLRASGQVGALQRIVVHSGEFLGVICGEWKLQDGTTTTPDPATRAGACTILLGKDRLVDTVLTVRSRQGADQERAGGLQDELMAVVGERTKGLWSAAGQLVDYLDDPAGYYEHGRLIAKVSGAVTRIHEACGR